MKRLHVTVASLFGVVFLLTGVSMWLGFPHTLRTDATVRMLLRSAHLYILLAALLNGAIAIHYVQLSGKRGKLQTIGSVALALAPLVFLLAFLIEPQPGRYDRPFVFVGVLLCVAGVLLASFAARVKPVLGPADECDRIGQGRVAGEQEPARADERRLTWDPARLQEFVELFQDGWDQVVHRSSLQPKPPVDRLKAAAKGGFPTQVQQDLGILAFPSGKLVCGNPHQMPQGLVVAALASTQASVTADVLRYPDGSSVLERIRLRFGSPEEYPQEALDSEREKVSVGDTRTEIENGSRVEEVTRERLGDIEVAASRIVLADAQSALEHWTLCGKERIGVIKTLQGEDLHRRLKRRFELKTAPFDWCHVRFERQISEDLEQKIRAYVQSIPAYAAMDERFFTIRTNNSLDRAVTTTEAISMIPLGNSPEPKMLVGRTGKVEDVYQLEGEMFHGRVLAVSIALTKANAAPASGRDRRNAGA